MKFIKADVLVLLSISSFVFGSADHCNIGDRGTTWNSESSSNNSYMI